MASDIGRLKAVFETNNGSASKAPINKPLPQPPSSKTDRPAVTSLSTTSPKHKSSSVKGKPLPPPFSKKSPGKADSLPPKTKPSPTGSPPTTKKEAASHLASVLKTKTQGLANNNCEVGGPVVQVHTSPPSNRRASETRKNSINGVNTSSSLKSISGSPKATSGSPKRFPGSSKAITGSSPKALAGSSPKKIDPIVKTPLKLLTGPGSGKTPSSMSGSPKKTVNTPQKPLSPPLNAKDKGGASSSSSTSNGTASTVGNVGSRFGVKLSHRENNDRGTPHSSSNSSSSASNKVKPIQPPPFNVKLRSTSVLTSSSGNSTNDSADVSSRDERSNSMPRDIEQSGSENQSSGGKTQRTPPSSRRPISVNALRVSGNVGKALSTSDLTKVDGSRERDKKSKPRPPPKKPGLMTGDKPFPPPKPSNVNRSPSKPLPKPPISHLKKNTDFNRARSGSTPTSSRESTPSLEANNEEQKSRSRSVTPLESGDSQIGDGSLEETLKPPGHVVKGHSDSTSSWVVIDDSSSSVAWKGDSKNSSSVPVKKTPPKTPPRVKSPESTSSSDGPKSPSVNTLRSKFGDRSSPPASPASPLGRTPGKSGENRYSSGMGALRETDPNKRDSPSLGGNRGGALRVQVERGGRSNADSGFISEVSDDLSTVGQATSNENVSEVMETPPTPLSPESQPEEQVIEEVWDDARLEKARGKRSNIAKELLETEKTYVGRIKLIAEDFYNVVKPFSEKSKGSVTDTEVMQIFLNIQQIHQLNQTILQSLETRIDSWSTEERLGDVICRLAPFLKLYSHYTSGFEEAMKTLTECTKKDKKFDAIVRDFERTTITTGLGVAHYMLEPIQRIPRYKLLLLDYLKYLPPDSPDRPDTEKALAIISEAADRNNDRIKELEISNEILSIQRSLSDYNGMLLQPYRDFKKKGPLQKMSRKNLAQRMFFLFSDVLIHTYPAHNGIYKFKDEMALCEMHIQLPTVSMYPHSFEVHCTSRSLLLVAISEEEKNEWMEALDSAIDNDIRKRRSLRRETFVMKRSQMKKFGYKAPIMVPDKSVSMCQVCTNEFTVLFRRHHCRACGKVVCSNCSQKKAYLQYLQKTERICESCYQEYQRQSATGSLDETDGSKTDSKTSSPKTPKKQDSAPGVLNLKAYDHDAVIAGYVLSQEGRKYNRVWYQVRQDCVLYKFRAHEDIKAYHSLPLPGYVVISDQGNCTIQLLHPSNKKELGDTFKVDDANAFTNWTQTLEKVVRMEIPSPTHQLQRDSRYSQSFEDSYSTGNQSPPHPTSFEASDIHSRPDSFESFSSGSFSEGSPENTPLTEDHQQT